MVFAAGEPIAWQSKLQTTVAASIMEVEYVAVFYAIQKCVWVKEVMSEICFLYDSPITLFMDSQSAIYLTNNPVIQDGVVRLLHVRSGEMIADIVTKTLATDAFEGHTISITGNEDYETSYL